MPAIAAALAAWTGLAVATALYLRARYEPVIAIKFSHAHQGWVVRHRCTGPNGHVLSTTQFGAVIERLGGKSPHALKWLTQHRYTFWARDQPDSRFWHFQLIEGGCLLALTCCSAQPPAGWSAAAQRDARSPAGLLPTLRA